MNYEEKYKKSLEKARELMDKGYDVLMPEIFPELQESEDERIRNFLIDFIKICTWTEKKDQGWPSREDCLAWLEKQDDSNVRLVEEIKRRRELFLSEKKKVLSQSEKLSLGARIAMLDELLAFEKQGEQPTDKVEPKFKVGDWVVNNVCLPMQIASIKDGMYVFTKGDAMSVLFIDGNYHLWTIQDAMDGDVLVDEDNNIGIYIEEKDDLYWYSRIYLGCDNRLRGFSIGAYHKHNNTKPATKEQCDLLFQRMKEAGYEWDAEKRELKKIEVTSKECEDEQMIERLKSCVYASDITLEGREKIFTWLEKQGDNKKLDADKVIEWLKPLHHGYIIDGIINKFKEDFGL